MRPSDDRRLLTEFSDAFINGADVCRWQCKRIRFEPGAEVGADFDGAGVGRLRYSGIEDDVTRFNAFDVETQGFIRAEPGKRAYGQIRYESGIVLTSAGEQFGEVFRCEDTEGRLGFFGSLNGDTGVDRYVTAFEGPGEEG